MSAQRTVRVREELLLMAKDSENAARACEAAISVFKPEFEALFAADDKEPAERSRMLQLHYYAIGEYPRQAKQMRDEAALLREAAGLLRTEPPIAAPVEPST